jgi:signal transduction histidine kinase
MVNRGRGSADLAEVTVLIVDDDPPFRWQLARLLAEHAFQVSSASTIGAAWQLIERSPPDLLIIDRFLAGQDGLDLCRRVKKAPETEHIPVIAISCDHDPDRRIEALGAEADHWLEKPVNLEELLTRAQVLIKNGMRHRTVTQETASLELWQDWVRYLVHDLRSPLTIALGNVSFALRDSRSDVREALFDAQAELERAGRMLQDVLDTDRLKRGVLVPRVTETDVGALVNEIFDAVALLATERGLALERGVHGRPTVTADPHLLHRVLTNLVWNAIRYAKTRVTVTVEAESSGITVRVANDGPGIPSDKRVTLFEPWVQLEGGAHGAGLGLAFCHLVMEAHGGWIAVESGEDGNVVFALLVPGARATP